MCSHLRGFKVHKRSGIQVYSGFDKEKSVKGLFCGTGKVFNLSLFHRLMMLANEFFWSFVFVR